ncbi:MAG: hypothetical protein H0X25_24200, partial [Acidobacteriales bacterium]|nr:hypothetical protein [Terriglobales bacterium]
MFDLATIAQIQILAYNGNMQVLTASQMRTCDERTVSQFGISFQTLMENAGTATAAFVLQQFPAAQRIT